jgi:hypothetical protein
MVEFIKYKLLWLLFRIPRLYMSRTQYAFWLMGWRERLRKQASAAPPRS